MKQQELEQGKFDEWDQAKMPEILLDHPAVHRLELTEGMEKYLEMTSGRKKPSTLYSDRNSLENLFDHFRRNGKNYIDEITPPDVQHLFNIMDKAGKSGSDSETIQKNAPQSIQLVDCGHGNHRHEESC